MGILGSAGCVQVSSSPTQVNQIVPGQAPVPGLLSMVPALRQSQPSSCGAASLQAVFNYRGIDSREGVLIQGPGTSEDAGIPRQESLSRWYDYEG